MPTQTQTKSKTQVTTGILIISAATIGIAAGIGYLTVKQDLTPNYRPGMFEINKNIGKLIPGYGNPGYTAKGLVCSESQFTVVVGPKEVAQIPKSSLIKAEGGAAVYWYAKNGKRYVFTDLKVYQSWYPQNLGTCPTIREIKPELVAQIQIAGNVQYRPFDSFIKLNSDPKVYGVAKGGVLHWVNNENLINQIVQPNWKTVVKDVPDAFFVTYTVGASVGTMQEWTNQMLSSSGPMTIDDALGL